MERVTKRIDKKHVCYAICEKECPDGIYADNQACMCTASKMAMKRLLEYEDTGLTPKEIQELKEAAQRLDKIFGDEITVDQVIDFFVDFYIAQGDPERVEAAELLTNEEVARYRELKERDTEKSVYHYHEEEKFRAYCPTCKRYLGIDFKEGYRGPKNTFCPGCGQRVKWEEE